MNEMECARRQKMMPRATTTAALPSTTVSTKAMSCHTYHVDWLLQESKHLEHGTGVTISAQALCLPPLIVGIDKQNKKNLALKSKPHNFHPRLPYPNPSKDLLPKFFLQVFGLHQLACMSISILWFPESWLSRPQLANLILILFEVPSRLYLGSVFGVSWVM